MIRNPIRKVLSSIQKHQVRALLMGGQACILYGAAEFSRDTDLAVLADPENLERLKVALNELQAEPIACPPFDLKYLLKGHSIHFRCHHPDTETSRLDLMSKMRGVAEFETLWNRRTTYQMKGGFEYDLLSIPDLIQAKKTQRGKDWPMIKRLVETHYFQFRAEFNPLRIAFWFRELRSAELLIQLASTFPGELMKAIEERRLLQFAQNQDSQALEAAISLEEAGIREADRIYWAPLKKELEEMRHEQAKENRAVSG